MVEIIFWLFLGGVIGGVITNLLYLKDSSFGVLMVDRRDPEKDVYRFDIHGDLDKLGDKKYITLRVDKNADLSQK